MISHASSHQSQSILATLRNWWTIKSIHSRCADLRCWIFLNETGGLTYDLFILELGLQSKFRCFVTPFLRVTSTYGIDEKDMQVWRLQEYLNSMERLMTATSTLKGNSNSSSCQKGHHTLNNFYSESTQMSWVLSSRSTGGKHCLLFIDEMSRKALIKTPKSISEFGAAMLELIKKEQTTTQPSLIYLKNDGSKDYKIKVQ